MKVKSESEVTQSCPTLRDPMDCSLPGSSAHGIFQARVLEWGAIAVCHNFSSEEQASFNFQAEVTICHDFGAQEKKSVTVSIVSPSICHEVMGPAEKAMASHSSTLA